MSLLSYRMACKGRCSFKLQKNPSTLKFSNSDITVEDSADSVVTAVLEYLVRIFFWWEGAHAPSPGSTTVT